MPIPRKKIAISLKQATPTALTVAKLKEQLTDVGLTCKDADTDKLAGYITDVKEQLPVGKIQAYSICQPNTSAQPAANAFGLVSLEATSSTGNWEPDDTGIGYGPKLEYIQYGTHFDWLKRNRPSFMGVEENDQYHDKYDTVDAVKQLFVKVGSVASATLVKGIDKDAIEAVLSNAIAPLSNPNVFNYDRHESRVIFLVENYNPQTQEADAVGVLTIEWHLKIRDYQEKKKNPQHETWLSVRSRSVLYSSLEDMNADYEAARTFFKDKSFAGLTANAIPKVSKVTIFNSLPPATADTFRQSLPKKSTTNFLDVIVLYAPNLQNVGSIDNTNSATTTTYSSSVTSGFTLSTSQTISAEAYFEASAEVVKAGFKIGLSIAFTEQWSSSQTTEFSFSVPGGKKAFTYQGYLMSRVLRFDAATGNYNYQPEVGRFVTNILSTSDVPLVDQQ
jgi:hypothetical protein